MFVHEDHTLPVMAISLDRRSVGCDLWVRGLDEGVEQRPRKCEGRRRAEFEHNLCGARITSSAFKLQALTREVPLAGHADMRKESQRNDD